MKKFISFLTVLCMVMALCIPCVGAIGASQDEEFFSIDAGTAGMNAVDIDSADSMMSRVIVARGARALVKRIVVYPAYYNRELGQYQGLSNLYTGVEWEQASDQAGAAEISEATTTGILNEFKSRTGLTADVWILEVSINVYTDGQGSYGKYFRYTPTNTCLASLTNGTLLFNLGNSTSSRTYTMSIPFAIPEDSTGRYSIGVNGVFGFYNKPSKLNLEAASSAYAYFNC